MKLYIIGFLLSFLIFSCDDSSSGPTNDNTNIILSLLIEMELTNEEGEKTGTDLAYKNLSSEQTPIKAELYQNGQLIQTINTFEDELGIDGIILFKDVDYGTGYKIKIILTDLIKKETSEFSVTKENSPFVKDTLYTNHQINPPSWFKEDYYFTLPEEIEEELIFNYTSEDTKIYVSPNPAKDQLKIKINTEFDNTLTTITIFEPWGHSVKYVTEEYILAAGSKTYTVDISDLPIGTYFVQVGKNKNYKFVFFEKEE